jgi:hypothetical protein
MFALVTVLVSSLVLVLTCVFVSTLCSSPSCMCVIALDDTLYYLVAVVRIFLTYLPLSIYLSLSLSLYLSISASPLC